MVLVVEEFNFDDGNAGGDGVGTQFNIMGNSTQ